MILVTVGMQLSFDRLIKAMDDLAPRLHLPVMAQTGIGKYVPKNMNHTSSISPLEFSEILSTTTLIVAHAGIGTVLTAQRHRKPIVLFPRRAAMGEHRNDHQLATAKELSDRTGIVVAMNEAELPEAINKGLSMDMSITPVFPERDRLRSSIENFINIGRFER